MDMKEKAAAERARQFNDLVIQASHRFAKTSYAKMLEAEVAKAAEQSNYDTFALGFVSGSATAISALMAALSTAALDEGTRRRVNHAFELATGYMAVLDVSRAHGGIIARIEQVKTIAEAAREHRQEAPAACDAKPQTGAPCEGPVSDDLVVVNAPEGSLP